MPAKLTQSSLKRLEGVHPHLVAVIKRAAEISDIAFQVTCGPRSLAAQRALVKAGASRTLKSRHVPAPNGLAHAVDLAVYISGKATWAPAAYHRLADIVKRAARELGIPVEWGGDWQSFFDGVHFQLPWALYPGIASTKDTAPPAPTEREMAVLVPGSRGELVMALQRDLNAIAPAFSLVIDGDYGPSTRIKVRAVLLALTGKETDIVTAPLRDKIAVAARKAARHT